WTTTKSITYYHSHKISCQKQNKTMEESRSYRRERKQTKKKKTGRGSGSGFGSIHMEMRRLRVLIPGGRRLNQPDLLISKTTDYVMHLKLRIRFLKTILSKLIV
ncbi:unnamed protein product, partial [Brassica oleracea var. botrytis]